MFINQSYIDLYLNDFEKHLKIVDLFLKYGANPNQAEIDKIAGIETVLMFAVLLDLESVELLLNYGTDPDIQDIKGETVLTRSVEHGDLKYVKLLTKHGASVHIRDKYGWSILIDAVRKNNLEILKIVLDHVTDKEAFEKDKREIHMMITTLEVRYLVDGHEIK